MVKWIFIGILYIQLAGCAPVSQLKSFKNRCEQNGGVYLDCAASFAVACSQAATIDGKSVICSCPEGTRWDDKKGCKK